MPTAVSDGLALAPVTAAQSKVCPPTWTDPASGSTGEQRRSTVTLVVAPLDTENWAAPAQLSVPSALCAPSVIV